MVSPAQTPADAFPAPHPFSIPNYRYFWASRLCSTLAGNALVLIVGWQAYNLARADMGVQEAAGILGLLGLIQFIPLFLLTPLVGWVADRLDRRWIVRAMMAVQVLLAVALGFLTYDDSITLPIIYAAAVVLGVCRAFYGPAASALAPNLVPTRFVAARDCLVHNRVAGRRHCCGPGIAGPLYAIDPAFPYFVFALIFAAGLGAMFLVGPVPRAVFDKTTHPVRQIVDGIAYVWTNKLVLGTITLDLFVMFLSGAMAMIPVFARDILGAGATGLSLLAASPGVGAVIVATLFSFKPLEKNVGNVMLVAMAVFGAATIGFGLSRNLYLSMACLSLCGAADMFGVYVRSSLIQLHTPDDKRGRVGAVSMVTVSASNELGDAMTGGMAVLLGPIAAIVAGGAGAIVVTALWSRLFPQIGAAKTFAPPSAAIVPPNTEVRENHVHM